MLKNNKEQIIDFMNKDHTVKEAAYEFNVTYQAMRNFLIQNNIKYRKYYSPFGDMSEADIIKFCENKSISEIAFLLKCDKEVVKKYMYYHGIKHKNKHDLDEVIFEKQKMFKVLSEKFSFASIARQFGVSRQYVEAVCKNRY